MSFIKNFIEGAKIVFSRMKTKVFWSNFAKVAIPFFLLVTVISIFLDSSSDIFSGDFAKISETNFSNGKWKRFFGFKIFFSSLYALYITNKKME